MPDPKYVAEQRGEIIKLLETALAMADILRMEDRFFLIERALRLGQPGAMRAMVVGSPCSLVTQS